MIFCDGCIHQQARDRLDYHPPGVDYLCGRLDRWVGFIDRVPDWCPGRTVSEMATKRKAARKAAKKKTAPKGSESGNGEVTEVKPAGRQRRVDRDEKKPKAKPKQSELFDKQLDRKVHNEIATAVSDLDDANHEFQTASTNVKRFKTRLAELLKKHGINKPYRVAELLAVPVIEPETFKAKIEPYKE